MLSRGGSLGEATADPERLRAWLTRHTERLVEELEFHRVWAGALSVSVAHRDGTGGFARAPLPDSTDRFDLLLQAGRAALGRAWTPGKAANRMHLVASDLRRPGCRQPGLFEPPAEQARDVARVKREINAAVGRFALRSGATLPLSDVYRDAAQSYDICDVRGKICF